MAKYKLTENGVLDTETGASIPDAAGNRHWAEYQAWLGEGNTADPIDVVDPWIAIRAQRDALLAECDWTRLDDASLPGTTVLADWTTYRQALRDIPTTFAGNPEGVVFPVKPV